MKAILMVDMPNTCEDCQFRSYNQCYALEVNRTLIEKWDGTDEFKKRNKICPLKPIEEYDNLMKRIRRLEEEYFGESNISN